MKSRIIVAIAALALSASAPALAKPATVAQEVASFVQPTPAARLAALKALLDAHGLAYEVQPFRSGKPGAPEEGYNVVVTLGRGEKDILLVAHYDAIKLQDGTLVDGVVDNAASVVALIHAADVLKGQKLKHRIRIVFTDQEEYGLLGGKAYAAGPDAGRIAGVINFDINAYGDTPFFAVAGATAPQEALNDAVKAGCKAAREDCLGFVDYPSSDHLAFRKAGVPAVSFSYLPKDEAGKLWAMMNKPRTAAATPPPTPDQIPRIMSLIHTPADRMAEVDPATVERAARLAVAATKAFDAAR